MQRWIARFLFLSALLGIFVPVSLAIAAPAPHACCIRKPHAANTTQIQAVSHPENCCPPRRPSHWAAPVAAGGQQCVLFVVNSSPTTFSHSPVSTPISYKSVRGPPA